MDETQNLVNQADHLANELLLYAQRRGIPARDFLVILPLAVRLLQGSICCSTAAFDSVLEADAIFKAVSSQLEAN